MQAKLALVAGSVLVIGSAATATAQVRYTTVALTGRPAPGMPAGVNYSSFVTPALNNAGQVAYQAGLTGTGVTAANDTAIFAGAFGSPQLVARAGNAAPGTAAGVNYASLSSTPTFNDAGQVAYTALLTGTGVTIDNDDAIYAGGLAAPQLVARAGNAAPGTTAGVNYSSLSNPALNDAGQVAYRAFLTGTGVTAANDFAIYAGGLAAPQLVALEGNAAPGTAAGVNYGGFGIPALNDAGQVAYFANLTGTGVTTANDEAIYAGAFGSPQLVARRGNAAPGMPSGVNYSSLFDPALNDAGQVAYLAFLTGTGVTAANDRAIYAGGFAAPQLVARRGNAAPGTPAGVIYSNLSSFPALNDAGQVAYFAQLTGTGVTAANDRAIYAGGFAAPRLVAREGNAAPGTPAGVNYSTLTTAPALNDAGQVAYLADLVGTGVTGANNAGLFAFDPVLGVLLIAREGDLFDVGGGDLRTIADNGIGFAVTAARGDETFTGLSNDGTLAFRLSFTDGSSGVFTAVVPEPAGLAPLAVAGAGLLRRRRGRGGPAAG